MRSTPFVHDAVGVARLDLPGEIELELEHIGQVIDEARAIRHGHIRRLVRQHRAQLIDEQSSLLNLRPKQCGLL